MTIYYCTATQVREQLPRLTYNELGFTQDADFTAAIETVLAQVKVAIDTYTHRQFDKMEDQTEIFDGKGGRIIFPTQTPILALTKVEYRGNQTGSWSEQTLTDFYAYDEYIYFEDRFIVGPKNYRITYDYGYEEVPADIERVAIQIAANVVVNWRLTADHELTPGQDFKVKAPAQDLIGPNEEKALRPYVKPAASSR